MSQRVQLPDARWFSDRRPQCEIEATFYQALNARNERDYALKLQEKGIDLYQKNVRKIPQLAVTGNLNGKK